MPMYGKNLLLQNHLTDSLETWGVASSMQVLQRYLNYDLDPFMPMSNLVTIVFVWEKVKIIFLENAAALGLKVG